VSDALNRFSRLPRPATSVLVASLIILPSANSVIHLDTLLARTDNRLLVVDWASRSIPAGTSVFLAGQIWRGYTPSPALGLLEAKYGLARPEASARNVRLVRGSPARYDQWSFDAASGRFESEGQVKDGQPRFIFTRESPLLTGYGPPEAITQILKRSYRLRRSFPALDMSRDHYWFDQQDGFFIPFAGFAGVERPGPNIHIYERTYGGPD
jgi:hypothetical protein